MSRENGSLLISNCRLFDSPNEKETTAILVEDGTITRIGGDCPCSGSDHVIDAGGRIVAPGLIDVHVQGAGGADVLDGTVESLRTVARTCARFGTTGFLATTVFRPGGDNRHLALAAENVGNDLGGADLLGVHLEGPFISLEKKGMISQEFICAPALETLDEIRNLVGGSLKMMTIAPELDGNLDIIRGLVDSGTVASFGHSGASYEETLKGISAGISHVTHLFNAMPSIHHRDPGPLPAIFESKNLSAQVISDGVHICRPVLKLAFELLGPDRCVTITDGMKPMGLADGIYTYGGTEYESKNGTARYRDGTLIGTSFGLIHMVLSLMRLTGCALDAAVRTAARNPAGLLGMGDRKGGIAVGEDADLIVLDHDYSVWSTVVRGRTVFSKP